jgi:hypothetical protein
MQESIWADGCPKNVKEEMKLSIQDLLLMGVDFLVKNYFMKKGFKVIETNGNINMLPNIVVEKDEVISAIAVIPCVFPQVGFLNDGTRLDLYHKMKEKGVKAYQVPLGFLSIDEQRAKAQMTLKGDVFRVNFTGFLEITDEEKLIFSNENQPKFIML